jgi:hypothetical protein
VFAPRYFAPFFFPGRYFSHRILVIIFVPARPLDLLGRDDTALFLFGSLDMSINTDLSCFAEEDLQITLTLSPPASVDGETFAFVVAAYPGGTPLITAPGTITDSANGVIVFALNAGSIAGDFEHRARRTTPGANAVLADGQFEIKPS